MPDEFIQTIFDSLTDPISVINTSDYTVAAANKAFIDVYQTDNFIGRHCYELTHHANAPCSFGDLPCPMAITLKTGKPSTVERIRHDGAGKKSYLEISGFPIRNKRGRINQLIHLERDITARKETEETLRRRDAYLQAIMDNIPYLMWLKDTEGRFLSVNNLFARSCGRNKPEEVIGKTDLDVWPRDLANKYRDDDDEVMTGLKQKHVEEPVADQNIIKWFETFKTPILDKDGRLIGTTGIAQDITKRKEAEIRIRKSEEKATQLAHENAIMAEIGRVISSTLDIDGVYERFAEEVKKVICFERISINIVEAENKTLTTVHVSGIDLPHRVKNGVYPLAGTITETAMKTKQGVLIQGDKKAFRDKHLKSFKGLRKGYRMGFRSFLSVPLISNDRVIAVVQFLSTKEEAYSENDVRLAGRIGNQIAGAIANAKLFSDRKLLEEERLNLETRLRRLEKMEALGTMASGVAHDLNNVLGVSMAYTELLQEKVPEGDPLRLYVDNILSSTEKGAAIIQDLLTLARRGVSVSKVIDLNVAVSAALKSPAFEKLREFHPSVTFKTELGRDLLNIKGSPVHLEKTIFNLISNAVESIPGKGRVTINTENRYLDMSVRGYDEVREGDYAVLTVSDNGGGISPADLDKIFEPFYTKKAMGRSGTGLGLSIVWGTVKDHNGYIDVRSTEGEGTTFTLYFPTTRETLVGDTAKIPVEKYMGHGESVLVVDDVAEQREAAKIMLTRLGYKVDVVPGGEEAVEYFKNNRADILVLDMIMEPGIDGLETYKRIREINPRQKAIIVSGFSETERVKEAQALGAGAYVKKPYIMGNIGPALREELKRKR